MALDVARVRAEFPALGSGAVFFDNPAGTQVPRRVIARTFEEIDRLIGVLRSLR